MQCLQGVQTVEELHLQGLGIDQAKEELPQDSEVEYGKSQFSCVVFLIR